jgi:CHAT domain-containing protein
MSRQYQRRSALVGLLLGISIIACRPAHLTLSEDPAAVYQSIAAERHAHPQQALTKAHRAYKDAEAIHLSVQWKQRFRLLYADVLVEQSVTLEGSRLAETKQLLAFNAQDAESAARQLATQAYAARKMNDFAKAKETNERALALADSVPDPCWRAEVLLHQVQTLLDVDGDPAGVLVKAGPEARNCSDPYWLTVWYLAKGNSYYSRFRFEQAKAEYETALHLAESHNFPALIDAAKPNLATAYFSLGDSGSALGLLTVGGGETARVTVEDEAHNLALAAAVHYQRSEYEAARAGYQRAVDLLKNHPQPEYYSDLEELAAVLLDMNRLPEAEADNLVVINHAGPELEPKWIYKVARINAAGIARMRGDPVSALQKLRTLMASLQRERDPEIVTGLHGELAQTFAALHRKQDAEREFKLAVEAANEVRGSIASDWNRLTYSVYALKFMAPYVDFRIDQHDPAGALQLAETFRARQLAEKLHFTNAPPAEQFQKIARARHAVILSYWITGKRSYVWATTGSEIKVFPLQSVETLERDIANQNLAIANSRDLLTSPTLPEELYGKLVAPVESLIPPLSNVIIVPDGPLAALNFETLVPPARPARFWLNSVSLTVAPSLVVLQVSQTPPSMHQQFLLVGGTIPAGGLKLLPDHEINDIQTLFPSVHTLALKGATATPQAFLDHQPAEFSLLHISAHAFANKESPLDSYIALTPDATHIDGRLYAHDLMDLKLNSDLVTLSVCEGAAGKSLPGEGLIGLTWALLSTGARNIVAGLWNVSDTATADFMHAFYLCLRAHENPAQALHDTKVALAKRQPSPYYWAPFQLYTR